MSTQAAQDRFFEHDGARLRWRLDGTGPAIVLLHGWALDLDYWNAAVESLAAHFTLLRFDRRGFGLSQGRPDAQRDLADLAALLKNCGLTRVLLIGMSQGARVALHFAHTHPALVHALVLDGAPGLDAEPELPLATFRRTLERDGLPALQAAIRTHPLMQLQREDTAGGRQLDAMLARYRGLDLQQQQASQASTPAAAAAPGRDAASPLHGIDVPALVLNGEHDTAERRQAAATLAATLPGASHVQLPGAGHLALLDDAGAYVRTILGFARPLSPW